jgi:hypothetical protein
VYDLLVARGARLDLKSKAGKTAKDLLEGVTGQ